MLLGYTGVVLLHRCDKDSVGACGKLVGEYAEGVQMELEPFGMGTVHSNGMGTELGHRRML